MTILFFFLFFFDEGPSHHSLKAFCATPMKMIRMSSFFYQFLQLMEQQWNKIDRGKPVPVPLCPPQISHGLDLGSNPGLRGERPVTNRLSHGTAYDHSCTALLGISFCFIFWYKFA
jgi:hypothetical protein